MPHTVAKIDFHLKPSLILFLLQLETVTYTNNDPICYHDFTSYSTGMLNNYVYLLYTLLSVYYLTKFRYLIYRNTCKNKNSSTCNIYLPVYICNFIGLNFFGCYWFDLLY